MVSVLHTQMQAHWKGMDRDELFTVYLANTTVMKSLEDKALQILEDTLITVGKVWSASLSKGTCTFLTHMGEQYTRNHVVK